MWLVPRFLVSRADRVKVVSILDIEEAVEWDGSRLLSWIKEADGSRGFRDVQTESPSERHCLLPVRACGGVGRRGFHGVARWRTVFRGFTRSIRRLGRVARRRFGRLKRRLGRSARSALRRWFRITRRRLGRSVRRPLRFLFGRLEAMRRPFRRRFGRTVRRIGINVRGFRLFGRFVRRFRRCVRWVGRIMRRLVRNHGRFVRRPVRKFVAPGKRLRRPIRTMRRLMKRLRRPMRKHRRLMRRHSRPMRMHGRHMRRLRLTMRRLGRPMRCTRRLGFRRRVRKLLGARLFRLWGEARVFGRVGMRTMRIFERLMRIGMRRFVRVSGGLW
jgi:hypothetical protein